MNSNHAESKTCKDILNENPLNFQGYEVYIDSMCNFGPEINEEDYDKNCTHPMILENEVLESSHLNHSIEDEESDGQIMKPYSSFKTNKLNNLSFKMKYLGE